MSKCVICKKWMHPLDAELSLRCSACGKPKTADAIHSIYDLRESRGRTARDMATVGGSALPPDEDADNWSVHRARTGAFRSGYKLERVTCHEDGTFSYYSVTTITSLRHAHAVLVGDEPFIEQRSLDRVRRKALAV